MSFNREAWLIVLTLFMTVNLIDSLQCVQCDRKGSWFSEDSERHIAKCQNGLIEPTKCSNSSHTHCIYSFYRQGASANIIVTERRCGVAEDVLGCTLYKSSRKRMKRHFFGGTSESDQRANSHKRREASLFVEVCTEGCEGDGCISEATRAIALYLTPLIFSLLMFFYTC